MFHAEELVEEIRPTQEDVDAFQVVMRAARSCPKIRKGLVKMSDIMGEFLQEELVEGRAAPNLQELMENYGGRRRYSMKQTLMNMLISVVKEERSRLGQREAVLEDEVVIMHRQQAHSGWQQLMQISDRARRRG